MSTRAVDVGCAGPLVNAPGLAGIFAQRETLSPRRLEKVVVRKLAMEASHLRAALRKKERRDADRFVQDMRRAASTLDAERRWRQVCKWLRPPRQAAELDAFREGDAADGRRIADPPAEVLAEGERIMRGVNERNVRNGSLAAVEAWLAEVTCEYGEVEGPDGGPWTVRAAVSMAQFQRMLARGCGKAVGRDASQCELCLAAPKWAREVLFDTFLALIEAARAAVGWQRMYVLLILKQKAFSDLVDKRRDISVMAL